MTFKKGDQVRVKTNVATRTASIAGLTGEIISEKDFVLGLDCYHVKFKNNELPFIVFENDLEIISEKKDHTPYIVIKVKGLTVEATDILNGKVGVAHCNPEDTFNLETGVKLAIERLFHPEEIKIGDRVKVIDDTTCHFKKGDIVIVKKILNGLCGVPGIFYFCSGCCRDSRNTIDQALEKKRVQKI